jgi:hypothetical protein
MKIAVRTATWTLCAGRKKENREKKKKIRREKKRKKKKLGEISNSEIVLGE